MARRLRQGAKPGRLQCSQAQVLLARESNGGSLLTVEMVVTLSGLETTGAGTS